MARVRGTERRLRDGDELDDKTIEALAAEAEVGYDLALAEPRRTGRPSLGEGVSPRVSFRASPTLYRAAQERAAREGRSVSDLAREAVKRYVAS